MTKTATSIQITYSFTIRHWQLGFILLLFLLIAYPADSVYAQDNDPSKDSETRNFSLNPNDLGALENSVNLFTGQVAFPMNLVSLSSSSGLGIALNIQYSSAGIIKQVDTWNVEAPTGILGLGWSMDIPKIVVDHKQTGTRYDDEFYVVESGQSIPLACIDAGSSIRKYKPVKDAFWQVEYHIYSEKWIITKENGYKFIYGDKNSERNTVQWMVKWGNWIGNSTQPAGQQQMAYIWNLSEVENLWGEKVTYIYDVVEEYVAKSITGLSTEKKHTKASYLKKITDPTGKSVELLYGEKPYNEANKEYQDPHVEQSEPDAYQEKYETRYLDRIIVNNESQLLYEVALTYDLTQMGTGDLTKRVLTSVQSIYPSGRSMPPLQFAYYNKEEKNEKVRGLLKKVTNAYGAFYEYTYERQALPLSQLDIAVDAPTPGQWKEHYVYTGNNYVLVVWRTVNSDGSHNPGYRPCKLWLYTWDGQWHKKDLTERENINLRTREDYDKERVLDWQVVMGENHFAFLYPDKDYTSRCKGRIYVKNPYQAHDWNLQSIGSSVNAQLLNGTDFVATSERNTEKISTYLFDGNCVRFEDIDVDEFGAELYVSAANNYIFVHNDNFKGQDYLYVFYLDEEKKWVKSSVSASQLINTDDGDGVIPSYWHSFNAFTLGLPRANEEFIYQWDENFNNIKRVGGFGAWDDDAFVFSRNNATLSIAEKSKVGNLGSVAKGRSARYDGNQWRFTDTYNNAHPKNIAFGTDFLIRNQAYWASLHDAYLSYYDPNSNIWVQNTKYSHGIEFLNTGSYSNGGATIEAGEGFFVMGDGDLYKRDIQGSWYYYGQLPLGSGEYFVGNSFVLNTPSFITYEYSVGKTAKPSGSYMVFFQNGEIINKESFPGYTFQTKPNHVGGSIMVHVNSDTKLMLRKITYQQATGVISVTHIANLKWYDGNQLFFNTYDFDPSLAIADPSGSVAYFNKAKVIPGSQEVTFTPYGATEYYFYNGLPADAIAHSLSSQGLHSYDQLRIGVPYATQVVDKEGGVVMLSQQELKYFRFSVNNTEDKQVAQVNYFRNTTSHQQANGITHKTTQTYDEKTGLVKRILKYTSQPDGQENQNFRQDYTYWYEEYDPERTKNILTPTIKAVSYDNNVPIGASTTTWKEWSFGKWAPEKSYSWLKSGNSDFTAWNAGQQPSPSQWKLTNTLVSRDPQSGTLLESSNSTGNSSASLYDHRQRVVATAQNATRAQIAYTSFEDEAQGNWTYSLAATTEDDALAGQKAFQTASGNIQSTLLSAGTYVVSYWAKDNVPSITASNGTLLAENQYEGGNGWTYHEAKLRFTTSAGRVTINSQGLLDELRLYPQYAGMTAYTYNAYGQILTQTASNGQLTFYEYDDTNRLLFIRDHKGQIVKRYQYRYRDEEEHYSVLLTYQGAPATNTDITFSATHPVYADGEVEYRWDFGDGATSTTTEPTVSHQFSSLGSYPVSVKLIYPASSEVIAIDKKVFNVTTGSALGSSVSIKYGDDTFDICPGNGENVTFQVSTSNGCPGYTYKWYIQKSDATKATSFGTGKEKAYYFNEIGIYNVYCTTTDGCGNMVNTSFLTITVRKQLTANCGPQNPE